ncbi:hypothetical protein J6590_058844 [Homalodisca vitripennis]|nr:hypothetical protein J6590_058844 [Homalodisca vitripennis]
MISATFPLGGIFIVGLSWFGEVFQGKHAQRRAIIRRRCELQTLVQFQQALQEEWEKHRSVGDHSHDRQYTSLQVVIAAMGGDLIFKQPENWGNLKGGCSFKWYTLNNSIVLCAAGLQEHGCRLIKSSFKFEQHREYLFI